MLQTRYSSMELIRGILHGSKVLLQHFHAIRGQKPFNDILRQGQETQDIAQSAGLEGFQILRRLAVLVQHQGLPHLFLCICAKVMANRQR